MSVELIEFKFTIDESLTRNDLVKICITTDFVQDVEYPDNNRVFISLNKSLIIASVFV